MTGRTGVKTRLLLEDGGHGQGGGPEGSGRVERNMQEMRGPAESFQGLEKEKREETAASKTTRSGTER